MTPMTPMTTTPSMTTTSDDPAAIGSSRTRFDALPGAGTYLVLAVWMGLVSMAVSAGLFEATDGPPPALVVAVAGPITAFAIASSTSSKVRRYGRSLDLRLVLAAQLWRVVGAGFLLAWAFDRLPGEFAVPAGLGDMATGVAALAVSLSLLRGTLTRRRLYAFTALGLGDFAVAVVTGLIIRPIEMDLWPLIVFPTVAVPFFAMLQIVTLVQAGHDWDERLAVLSANANRAGRLQPTSSSSWANRASSLGSATLDSSR